jgi:hypothetical protein
MSNVFLCIANMTEWTHTIRKFAIEHPPDLENAVVSVDSKISDVGGEVCGIGHLGWKSHLSSSSFLSGPCPTFFSNAKQQSTVAPHDPLR